MSCPRCPVRSGRCRGEDAARMCELMDPGRADHDPRYGPLLVALAAEAGVPAYPPLATQAANLAGSLRSWAGSGFSAASEGLVERRRATCAGCPEWAADARRCRLCGCKTEAKIRLATEHCPIGKW